MLILPTLERGERFRFWLAGIMLIESLKQEINPQPVAAALDKRDRFATRGNNLQKAEEQCIDRSINTSFSDLRSTDHMNEVQTQRVTLLDIAADAGVSRATVSLVIRNVPSVAD